MTTLSPMASAVEICRRRNKAKRNDPFKPLHIKVLWCGPWWRVTVAVQPTLTLGERHPRLWSLTPMCADGGQLVRPLSRDIHIDIRDKRAASAC